MAKATNTNTEQNTATLEAKAPAPTLAPEANIFDSETEVEPSKPHIPYEAPAGIQSGFAAPTISEARTAQAGNGAPVERSYKVFKLKHGGKGKVGIHGVDDVINPKTGRVERVKLIRGVSSIWASEQKDLDKSYIENNIRQLIFEDRVLRIDSFDKAALDFLALCNHNVDNKNKVKVSKYEIFEWNPNRQAEAAALKRQRKLDAIKAAMKQPFDVVKKHGSYLAIKFTDELGEPFDERGLRNEYELKAEEMPEEFLTSLGSQSVEISYQIKRAIRDSRIDLGRQPNQAHWMDGGFICQVPQNRETVAYLIELASTNSEEGRAFKERLQIIMGK